MEVIRTKQWRIHLLTSWGQALCKVCISCLETYQAFPFPVWVGGEPGSKVGSGGKHIKGSYNSISSQSVVATVTVISMESHNGCWTLTSHKFSNHDVQPFITWSLPDALVNAWTLYAPRNSPGCTEFLSYDACLEPQMVSDIQHSQTTMFELCTTEIHQMHRILSHNVWTTYHRVHPGVQNSQAMMLANELCTTDTVRCTEFSATMLELHTIEFHPTYGILKPWLFRQNCIP